MPLAKRVIPCLDVTAGRVVKGVNFVGLRDAGDPVEIAARYDGEGADELCFLDITASSDERDILLHVIEAVASRVFIPLTVGGGVRKVGDVCRVRSRRCAGDRLGRRRRSRAPRAGVARGQSRCGAGGEHLPFRRLHRAAGERAPEGAGHRGAHMSDWLDEVPWNGAGLIAAVAQDAESGRAVTVAGMTREDQARTPATPNA